MYLVVCESDFELSFLFYAKSVQSLGFPPMAGTAFVQAKSGQENCAHLDSQGHVHSRREYLLPYSCEECLKGQAWCSTKHKTQAAHQRDVQCLFGQTQLRWKRSTSRWSDREDSGQCGPDVYMESGLGT